MSTTMQPVTTAAAITKATDTPSLVQNLQTAVLSGARDAPGAIKAVAALDPDYAAWAQGTSLAGSKTVWFPAVSGAVSWAVGRWALGWDPATVSLVAGVISWSVLIAVRYVTTTPITSLLPRTKNRS